MPPNYWPITAETNLRQQEVSSIGHMGSANQNSLVHNCQHLACSTNHHNANYRCRLKKTEKTKQNNHTENAKNYKCKLMPRITNS